MAVLVYQTLAFFALFSYGLYHLISAVRSHLKLPSHSARGGNGSGEWAARPYYPLPLSSSSHHLLRHLPLFLAMASLLIAIIYNSLASPHFIISLQTSAALSLFVLLAASVLLPLPPPPDLTFLLSALAFGLLSSASSRFAAASPPSDLQRKASSISSLISGASAALSVSLALSPKLVVSELALAASISLQGLWSLQSGLSLYAEGFIPEGCHRLLDVPEGSTRCDLDSTRTRAAAILDLAFALHCTLMAAVMLVVYVVAVRALGGAALARRHNGGGSYEALPTSGSAGMLSEMEHVQMKVIGKNSSQA